MVDQNISTFSSVMLDDIKDGSRTVLYEELAEYFYLFARKDALKNSSIDAEINYHIGNLVLISLYFDVVFVQTASIFNSSDPFIQQIINGVLNHKKFREMLDNNVLKIVGWGGNTPKEMFKAARDFSQTATEKAVTDDQYSVIASVFNSQSTVSRSTTLPDTDIETLFFRRLKQTTIIRKPEELSDVRDAAERSMEATGQFVAVSFNPHLQNLNLSSEAVDAVGTSFIQSWHDHLSSEIPGVVTYAPLATTVFINQEMMISHASVRTFLYSPQIFASFLGGYISSKDFNKILSRPYSELMVVKNGDWGRFVGAYHKAVLTVSENIGHLEHAQLADAHFANSKYWSSALSTAVESDMDQLDLNAFIESLAMLSGVVFTIPFLGPAVKTASVFAGKAINETFHTIRKSAANETSPFIRKLLNHYDMDGIRA